MRAGVVVVLLAVGCSSGGSPAPSPTASPSPAALVRFTGKLTRVGGPYPGSPVPTSGSVRFAGAAADVTVQVGDDGRYASALPPGRYAVSARGSGVPCSNVTSVVLAGTSQELPEIVCVVP